MAAWIQIRIPNADPDPGGLNRAKKEGKNASKRQIIKQKKDSKQCNCYKMDKCYFFRKVKIFIPDPHRSAFIFKTLSGSAFA
jgi:hypothetical protein